ncbi:hypothetical protein JZU54_00855, partial [bacterium]|nr:hypothetical protein [bacterium]
MGAGGIQAAKDDFLNRKRRMGLGGLPQKPLPDHSTAGHDIAVGGIEGGLGVLATDRLIHKFAPKGSGVGRKIAIGAGVGAAAT